MAADIVDEPGVESQASRLAAGTIAGGSDGIEAGRVRATKIGDGCHVGFG